MNKKLRLNSSKKNEIRELTANKQIHTLNALVHKLM